MIIVVIIIIIIIIVIIINLIYITLGFGNTVVVSDPN